MSLFRWKCPSCGVTLTDNGYDVVVTCGCRGLSEHLSPNRDAVIERPEAPKKPRKVKRLRDRDKSNGKV